eukprot:2817907-Prorocentrum_lima.AAC.1
MDILIIVDPMKIFNQWPGPQVWMEGRGVCYSGASQVVDHLTGNPGQGVGALVRVRMKMSGVAH